MTLEPWAVFSPLVSLLFVIWLLSFFCVCVCVCAEEVVCNQLITYLLSVPFSQGHR